MTLDVFSSVELVTLRSQACQSHYYMHIDTHTHTRISMRTA